MTGLKIKTVHINHSRLPSLLKKKNHIQNLTHRVAGQVAAVFREDSFTMQQLIEAGFS